MNRKRAERGGVCFFLIPISHLVPLLEFNLNQSKTTLSPCKGRPSRNAVRRHVAHCILQFIMPTGSLDPRRQMPVPRPEVIERVTTAAHYSAVPMPFHAAIACARGSSET